MSNDPTIQRLSGGRIECTHTFDPITVGDAEEKAVKQLGGSVSLPGFRPGMAPADQLKAKIDPNQLFEATVHELLPSVIEKLVKENNIQPIIHPKVEAVSRDPLTLKIVFIEKPEVTVNAKKIKVDKKDIKTDAKDVDTMINYMVKQHTKAEEVEREAKEGDRMTLDFVGKDKEGKEVEGTRIAGHQVTLGSKTLIPGFEDELMGLKKGTEKSFTVTFPEKYHAEHLQGQPVTFDVKVHKVEELTAPELTDEFVQKELDAESVPALRTKIEESMRAQEEEIEKRRREQVVLDELEKSVKVELAPELIEDEINALLEELERQLQQQGKSIKEWVEQQGKSPEDMRKEFEERAGKRLRLRLGMEQLVKDKAVEISDDEMKKALDELLGQVSPEQRKEIEPAYAKGQRAYDQLLWQKKVEKVIESLLA